MMKDMIIEIAVLSDDFYNLSLCCKKYYSYIIDNKDFWRRKIKYKFDYLSKEKDLRKLKELWILLENISQNPQLYYRKSITDKDNEMSSFIFNLFKVYYPYIGIINPDSPNYFSIVDIINIKDIVPGNIVAPDNIIIPDNIINLANMDQLSVSYHCRNMGIIYTYDETYNMYNIKRKLSSLNLIFNTNEKNDYLFEYLKNRNVKKKAF